MCNINLAWKETLLLVLYSFFLFIRFLEFFVGTLFHLKIAHDLVEEDNRVESLGAKVALADWKDFLCHFVEVDTEIWNECTLEEVVEQDFVEDRVENVWAGRG